LLKWIGSERNNAIMLDSSYWMKVMIIKIEGWNYLEYNPKCMDKTSKPLSIKPFNSMGFK